MADPRPEVLKAFSPKNLRIKAQGFKDKIFFCGGQLDGKSSPPLSLRDHIHRHLVKKEHSLSDRIILAERFTGWFGDSFKRPYYDLISFEKDLAVLAGLVVLFLESPGSFAELGAFSQVESIASRLHVFIRTDYHNHDSFIALGPVKYLEHHHPGSIHVYPWQSNNPPDPKGVTVPISTQDDIINDIKIAANKLPAKETFKPRDSGHQMLFICGLLDQFIALQKTEISSYFFTALEASGVHQFSASRFDEMLFVLEKMGLVGKGQNGNSIYYVARNPSPIVGHTIPDIYTPWDMVTIKAKVIRPYYLEHHPRRLAVAANLLLEPT